MRKFIGFMLMVVGYCQISWTIVSYLSNNWWLSEPIGLIIGIILTIFAIFVINYANANKIGIKKAFLTMGGLFCFIAGLSVFYLVTVYNTINYGTLILILLYAGHILIAKEKRLEKEDNGQK